MVSTYAEGNMCVGEPLGESSTWLWLKLIELRQL